MEKVIIKSVMNYAGHAIRAKGVVTINLKSGYDELPNTVQMCQFLHQSFRLDVKLPNRKAMIVGNDFRMDMIKINKDGSSDVRITGITDFTELDTLNMLINEDNTSFRFSGEVDLEEDEGEDEDV